MTSAVLVAADLPPGQPWVSPDDLSAITPLWQEASEATLIPIVAQVYNDAAGALHTSLVGLSDGAVPAVTSLASEQYLAAARNTFTEVGNDLWETARSELLDGFQKGESIPELRDRLRQSAGLTNRRATYVARTQVLDASNAGSYDTAQASGLDLVKGWEATPDLRTRETHLMAASTYSGPGMIPMADMFMVGGWPCERPHDPELPPEERYNCRCTTVYAMRPVVIDRRQAYLDDLAAQHQAKLDVIRARYERRLAQIQARHEANLAAIQVTSVTPSVSVEQAIVTSETRLAQAVAAHDARVARLTADYEFRQAKLKTEYDYRVAQARGEEPPPSFEPPTLPSTPPPVEPPPLPAAPAPTAVPVAKPVDIPIRQSLAQATTVPEVRAAFIREWRDAIAAEPGAIRGSARFLVTGDVQTAREHAEGLLRAIERFPMVRVDVGRGFGPQHWAETVGHEIKFSDHFARVQDREFYLLSLRQSGIPDPNGVAWHPMSISSPQAIAMHEFSHALQYSVARDAAGVYDYAAWVRINHEIEQIANKLANERRMAYKDLVESEIGGYAATSPAELAAEAFADVMVNGDAASELSQRIVAMLIRRYEAQNGPMVGPPLTGLPKLPSGPPATSATRFAQMVREAKTGEEALNQVPIGRGYRTVEELIDVARGRLPFDAFRGLGSLSNGKEIEKALRRYSDTRRYRQINTGLRREALGGRQMAAAARDDIKLLDEALDASRLDRDILVWRGPGEEVFKGTSGAIPDDLAGFVWTDAGYTSTSTSQGYVLETFGSYRPVLRIVVPKGSKAIQLSTSADEAEVLLSRGLTFRVVKDYGTKEMPGFRSVDFPTGVKIRLMDVEIVPRSTTAPLAVGDGLDAMTITELKALAKARDLTGLPAGATKVRLVEALRAQVAADQNLANAIAEAVDLMERALASGNAARARTALADAIKLLQDSPGAELALRAANLAPTGARTVIDRLRKLAEQRGLTLPTGRQLSALKTARAKAVRAEKARLAAIKKQTAAINRGEFEHLTAGAEPGVFTTPDGGTWLVESFATEQEARERALYAVLHHLVTGDKGAPPPTFVIGRGAAGLKGWQVAYPDMTTALPAASATDWLTVPLARLQALTPARIKALVAKIGLNDDLAKSLISQRATALTHPGVPAFKIPPGIPAADLARARRMIGNGSGLDAYTVPSVDAIGRTGARRTLADVEWLVGFWKRNPATYAHMIAEARHQAWFRSFRARYLDLTPTEVKRRMVERMTEALSRAPIVVNRNRESSLRDILTGGRFRTQFETKESSGLLDNEVRSQFESAMWGYPADLAPQLRPVYGYLATGGADLADLGAVTQYGGIRIVLKEAVRARTSFTIGDSLNTGVIPSPITKPSWQSWRDPWSWSTDLLDTFRESGFLANSYVEAQIHGGIGVDDIAEVIFSRGYKPDPLTIAELLRRGIPWRNQ